MIYGYTRISKKVHNSGTLWLGLKQIMLCTFTHQIMYSKFYIDDLKHMGGV